MRLFRLCALALAAECAHGYLDTTPFFMFSTSELLTTTSHIQSGSLLTTDIALALSSCPSNHYIFISQTGVTSEDYSNGKKSTPFLSKALSQQPGSSIRSSLTVPEVLGPIDTTAWEDVLISKCGAIRPEIHYVDGKRERDLSLSTMPQLLGIYFLNPYADDRAADLLSNDMVLESFISNLPTQNYTVLYTTTRDEETVFFGRGKEPVGYDMDSQIQESLHLDLKRDVGVHVAAGKTENNQTMIDGPLFDKYQFLTPGIFMGFLVGFLLLSILYVAISAVSSLQVTYAAFDKDQGQLSVKKQ